MSIPGLGAASAVARQTANDSTRLEIRAREVVVLREADASVRLVESIELAPAEAAPSPSAAADPPDSVAPLRLVRLPPDVREVVSLQGDVPSDRVTFDAPHVLLLGPRPDSAVRLNLTYRLPDRISRLEFVGDLPTRRLVVSVAGQVGEPRPARRLQPDTRSARGTTGFQRFTADSLSPGEAAALSISHLHITWRQRVAVMLTTVLAATLALGWVWRRGAKAV